MNSTSSQEFHQDFAAAFNSGDTEVLLSLYEPDAALVPEPGTVATGHPEIGAALKQFQAVGTMTAETRYCIEIGDVALASAAWRISGTGPDAESVEVSGTSADLLRRQSDGRWLLVVDHPFGADDRLVTS